MDSTSKGAYFGTVFLGGQISMINPGDKVFYSDNKKGEEIFKYSNIAVRIIEELGLIPLKYVGIELGTRNSSLDKDIREDFFQSKVVILLLGKGDEREDIIDHWAIPELEIAISMGIACFIYITSELTEEEIQGLGLPVEPVMIDNENQFAVNLRQTLNQLMIAP